MRDSAAARAAVPRLVSIAGLTAGPGPGSVRHRPGPRRGGPVTTVLAGGTVLVSLHPAEVVTGDVVIEGTGSRRSGRGPPPVPAAPSSTAAAAS